MHYKKKKKLFSLSCGCKDSKSTSISPSSTTSSTTIAATTSLEPDPITTTSFEFDDSSSPTTPTFSGLLNQLSDLEHSVLQIKNDDQSNYRQQNQDLELELELNNEAIVQETTQEHRTPRHRRWQTDGRVKESVAVVKESDDPLGDFRRSMLQMIVEKEIVDAEGLRELLRRFLHLNCRTHHDVILRAFAEIWREVFEGYEDTPEVIRRSRSVSVSNRR